LRKVALVTLYFALALTVAVVGGYLVVAFMARNTPEVAVPAIEGHALSEAVYALTELELDLEVRSFVFSDAVPENHVVLQRPPAGRIIKAGRSVGVILSRGAERLSTPQLFGRPLEDAAIALSEAQLGFEVAARIPGPVEADVLAQSIIPGAKRPSGTIVGMVVSKGPTPVRYRLPKLEGMTVVEAQTLLAKLGLRVERVTEVELSDQLRAGRVVNQEPLPGFPVERGTGVTLSVAGSAYLPPTGRAVMVERYLPPGLGTRHVEVFAKNGGDTRTLVDEQVEAGTTFRKMLNLNLGESIEVRVDGGK
jgi:beta-lactam-binding protein with PASTA domain